MRKKPESLGRSFINAADLLKQSLAYTEAYNGEIVIVKMGGELADSPDILDNILKQILQLKRSGIHPILVHGGGPQANEMLKIFREQNGYPEKSKEDSFDSDGDRITEPYEINLIAKVFREINDTIVNRSAKIIAEEMPGNIKPHRRVRVEGHNGRYFFEAEKKSENLNNGIITGVDSTLFERFTNDKDLVIPVFYSICFDENGDLLNINADKLVAAMGALRPAKAIFVTNVPGIMDKNGNVLSEVTAEQIQLMKNDGTISGGMIAKVDSLTQAVESGAKSATIVKQDDSGSILIELLTDAGAGTTLITSTKDNKINPAVTRAPV